ncbi:MAG: hypothetical protein DWQ31_10315 [Planctomycetota bacterium]|nr:MAG: hypothetical protein DWQ31_10315 [Planctomycetota bacterium]
MSRYRLLAMLLVVCCAVACRSQPVIGDPFGRTTIPPPATGGVPAAATPAPYYPQPGATTYPQPTYPQPGATRPGNLVPVPNGTVQPQLPATPQPGLPPAGQPIYPSTPQPSFPALPQQPSTSTPAPTFRQGSGIAPSRSAAPQLADATNTQVRPVSHQPRLRPVPSFSDNDARSTGWNAVVNIDADAQGEPVIRIEENAAPASVSNAGSASSEPAEDESVFDDEPADPLAPRGSVLRSSRTSSPVTPASATIAVDAEPSTGGASVVKPPAQFRPVAVRPPARYGHAPDYSWLKGRLEYSAARKQWKLRYLPLDGRTDEYGGSVVLDNVDESSYAAGDFVAVRGQLGKPDPETRDFAATYRVTQMKSM